MKNIELKKIPTENILLKEDVLSILKSDTTASKILDKNIQINQGDLVGVRLNLNILKSTGIAIQTIHNRTNNLAYKKNKGFYNGEAIGYSQVVVLKNAYFNVNQQARDNIASGKNNKYPMASVDGFIQMTDIHSEFQGIEIGFNPHKHHLFVDNNNEAIHYAEEVVILGHKIYARGNIKYHTDLTAPKIVGDSPTQTIIRKGENLLLKNNF